MKKCSKCKELKDIEHFYGSKHKGAIDGYDYYCKYCRNGESLKSHRSKAKKCSLVDCNNSHYAKNYCRTHYARFDRNGTTDRLNTKIDLHRPYLYEGQEIEKRAYALRTKYNLTIAEYKKRGANGCQICGARTNHNLHVDHDHSCCNGLVTCGKCVRGVVCHACNVVIDKYEEGLLRNDNPKIELVKSYINKYKNDILV